MKIYNQHFSGGIGVIGIGNWDCGIGLLDWIGTGKSYDICICQLESYTEHELELGSTIQ